VVVATVQTLNAGNKGDGRVAHFDPDEFGLLVIDEAHHSTAKSYRDVIEYFRKNKSLKVLGVTATPDRSDEEALGPDISNRRLRL
jgi:superfamily II DNA or RNA helicase